jgi:PAS domain S-box-containing protein
MGDALLSIKMPHRVIEWATDAFFRQTGYGPEECIGKTTEFLYPDRDSFLEFGRKFAKACQAGDELMRGEQIIRRKNGEFLPVEYTVTLVRNEKGEVTSFTAIARDITERRQAEEALRRSEQSLKMAQKAGNIGTWDWDVQSNLVTWSDETYRRFGLEPGQINPSYKSFESFIHPSDKERIKGLINQTLNGGQSFSTEARMLRADGSEWIMYAQGTVYRGADGKVKRFAGIHQDITKQRQLEEQLRQTDKLQAIGQLAGGVAHDFNNQLSVIMGFADMLRARLNDKDLISFTDDILSACRRSRNLTSQMLAFARKGKIENDIFNIHEVIGEVARWLEHSIDKRINILQRLEANPSTTRGDRTQIQNALLNIAINARDAMPGGGQLIFETAAVDLDGSTHTASRLNASPGRYLCISITDNGIGMDEETAKHVFEPFFTTKKAVNNTGMGLAAVYGTMESHGGIVDLESEVGRGTTLNVYLPVVEAASNPLKSAGGITKSVPATNIHILLVDDEELVRKVCNRMLHRLGYKVTTAGSGRQGIEYYRKSWKSIDLVIIDMVMPDLSGLETYREMREINPGIKSILSSGYSIDSPAQEALDEGVRSFIQKPFDVNELSDKVNEVLNQKI